MINSFKLGFNMFELNFETNYGCDKRKGWSIATGGHYWVQFEKYLIAALFKTIKGLFIEFKEKVN